MAVKGFNEGAASPLLFARRSALVLAASLLLAACSHDNTPPPFTASGYLADDGAVRLWRKDSSNEAVHLLAVFSPWRAGATTTREYRWQGERLSLIDITRYSTPPEKVRIRFDELGELSFMQRERDGQKQQLSNDDIALYRYHAERTRATSDALRTGRVVLYQGRWNPDYTVTTCEGKTVKPELDDLAMRRIVERQQHASLAVSVAWLEAPEGAQLLLVANSDFCHWQPNAKDF